MSDTPTPAVETEPMADADPTPTPEAPAGEGIDTAAFKERYKEVLGTINQTLGQIDWSQMGRIGKAGGILLVVIIAQILIKGVLDTVNLLPVVPGLLELLGLVVVGQWGWKNLTTSEKRSAVVNKLQTLRNEYLT